MKPGNRTHNVKILYDEVIPLEGNGLDGNTPLDIERDCKLQIITKTIKGVKTSGRVWVKPNDNAPKVS